MKVVQTAVDDCRKISLLHPDDFSFDLIAVQRYFKINICILPLANVRIEIQEKENVNPYPMMMTPEDKKNMEVRS